MKIQDSMITHDVVIIIKTTKAQSLKHDFLKKQKIIS